jgi:hypothetical protein
MALLGKISAVLTANTQDFTRRIGESRRELQDFARQARGIQFNLNTRALDGTLTQLQRFQRTLREIQQLQARGVDAGLPNVGRLRDQFRAFEDIGRPLTQVRGLIEGLANSLQSQLYPELGRVQAGFQDLYRSIGEGATTYDASRQRIDSLRTSLVALGRATAAVGDFDRLSRSLNANNSGGAFFQPRALDSLQRSLSLRGRAQEVPAAFRSDVFADLAVQAEESAERVARAAARVARYQLEIATAEREGRPVTSLQLANRGIAQRRLDNETSRQNAINLSFQRELDSAAIQQIVSPGAERQVTALRERLAGLATELRAINGQQFNGLISGAAAVVEQFNRGTASAREAKQAVDALAASLSAANTTRGLQQQTESLIFTPRDLARRSIQRDFDRQVAGLAQDDPRRGRAAVERFINLNRETLNSEIIPRTQAAAQSARSLWTPEAERQANRILEINRQINAELTRATNLNNNNQRNEAVARLQRIAGLLAEQQRVEAEITDQVEIRNAARRQEELFLQASGGSAEQLSQGGRDAAADLSVARQFRGQISNGLSRIQIQGEIDRVTAGVVALQQQMARVAASDMGLDERAAELDRLDNEIRQSTRGLAEFVAARSGGAFGTRQIEDAMRRARNQAGSLTASSAQTAQLAFQQALFAIDDLVSSTGGLEYKLRAVGNNITQLGLLLGQSGVIPGLSATTGLFIGLSAVLGGQAISAILRYVSGSQQLEDRTKGLNSTLSAQRALLQQITQGFASIGQGIVADGFSSAAKSANELALALERIARQQQELKAKELLATNAGAVEQIGLQERIGQRLEASDNPGQAIARRRLQAELRRSEFETGRALLDAPPPSGIDVRNSLSAAAARLRFTESTLTGSVGTSNAIASRGFFGALQDPGAFFGFRRRDPVLSGTALQAERLAASVPLGATNEDRRAQVNALDDIIERLKGVADRPNVLGFRTAAATEASNTIRELEEQRLRLLGDNGLADYFKKAADGARSLAEAQELAAKALSDGIPEAAALQSRLDGLAEQIRQSEARIAEANALLESKDITLSRRNEIVDEESRKIEAGRRGRDAALADARAVERRRQVDGQSLFAARADRTRANLQESGAESGVIARRLRELEARRAEIITDLSRTPGDKNAQQALEATNRQIAEIEAATLGLKRFSEALARATAEAESNLQAAQQRDDDIRRQRLAPGRGADIPTRADRDRARRNVEEQRAANRAVEETVAKERDRLERLAQDPNNPPNQTFARLREIDEQLNSGAGTTQDRTALIEERRRLQDQVDRQIEGSPAVRAARDNSTRIEQRQLAENRGRELLLRPGQRARRELDQQLRELDAEINQRAAEAARDFRFGDIPGIQNEGDQARRRLQEEASRQQAPTIFSLADQVQNAILRGPSRAALNVADASTVEGSRELSRLLRGDDAARDQNSLVELQKEANRLLDLIANNPANIAN